MKKGGFVYILTNKWKNVIYIGVIASISRRIFEHKAHLNKGSFSDKYNLEFLIYFEYFDMITAAIEREKQLKKWSKSKKEKLINTLNPSWNDLYEEIIDF